MAYHCPCVLMKGFKCPYSRNQIIIFRLLSALSFRPRLLWFAKHNGELSIVVFETMFFSSSLFSEVLDTGCNCVVFYHLYKWKSSLYRELIWSYIFRGNKYLRHPKANAYCQLKHIWRGMKTVFFHKPLACCWIFIHFQAMLAYLLRVICHCIETICKVLKSLLKQDTLFNKIINRYTL